MFKPKEMVRVCITGTRDSLESTISELHALRLLHIRDFDLDDPALSIGKPLDAASVQSELLVKIRSISNYLKLKKASVKKAEYGDIEKKITGVREIEHEVTSVLNEMKEAESRIKEIEASKKALEPLSFLPLPMELLSGYSSLAVFVGFLPADGFEQELRKITEEYEFFSAPYRKSVLAALFVPVACGEDVQRLLSKRKFSGLDVPKVDGKAGQILSRLDGERKSLEAKLQKLGKGLAASREKWGEFLLSNERALAMEAGKSEAPLKFAFTDHTFLIDGFIPADSTMAVCDKLSSLGVFMAQTEGGLGGRETPVFLDNPKPARPYEMLINLFTLPKYGEIDPTAIMFFTFPFFFGMMLGDIGYGIVSALLFYFLKTRFRSLAPLFTVLIYSSVVSILFGFIFGEFFGFEEIGAYKLPHLFARMEDIIEILAISVGIGVLHVNLGLVLGFLNLNREHGFVHALYGKGSWIIMETGIALFALSYTHVLAIPSLAGGLVALAGVGLLLKGEGAIGLIEILSLFGNILSYARLLAIGLSSVAIAFMVNTFSEKFYHMGGVFFVLMLLLLIFGHAGNIVLGLMGSFLHSLRLHYVEFFTKFYKGGGIKYSPFGYYEEEEG